MIHADWRRYYEVNKEIGVNQYLSPASMMQPHLSKPVCVCSCRGRDSSTRPHYTLETTHA